MEAVIDFSQQMHSTAMFSLITTNSIPANRISQFALPWAGRGFIPLQSSERRTPWVYDVPSFLWGLAWERQKDGKVRPRLRKRLWHLVQSRYTYCRIYNGGLKRVLIYFQLPARPSKFDGRKLFLDQVERWLKKINVSKWARLTINQKWFHHLWYNWVHVGFYFAIGV